MPRLLFCARCLSFLENNKPRMKEDEGLAVRYLIDGYNLLFAHLGTPPSRHLTRALERARRRLLEQLRAGHGDAGTDVTVVFDAAHAPLGAPAELDYHGIHVSFAVHQERADDLIEQMIRQAPAPRQLTVVTNDHHIQHAARRRHCNVMECDAYLNWLEQPNKKKTEPNTPPAKPVEVSPEDTEHWLDAFTGLESDPAMRELADPHGPVTPIRKGSQRRCK
jgi:predicted RNA-binding protein with PIN domain